MKKFLGAAVLALIAIPAVAQDRSEFNGTGLTTAPGATITLDGITSYVAFDAGRYANTGGHGSLNTNYTAGRAFASTYNNFFSFVLPAAAPISPYTSAVLSILNGTSVGSGPAVYTLYDVSTPYLDLDASRPFNDAGGQTVFADLGSGTSYGSFTFTQPTTAGTTTDITLNQAFLDRVNAGLLMEFSIGGALDVPTGGVVPAVPEPATWAMMLVGFGAIGAAARYRRRKTNVAFA